MYLNSGDWVEHMTSLEFYNNDWHIYEYDEKTMNQVYVKEIFPETEVLTTEVAFYLHSLNIQPPPL